MSFSDRLDRLFIGKDLEHFLLLPSLAVVESLEDSQYLKNQRDQSELVVAHMPIWLQQHEYTSMNMGARRIREHFKLDGRRIRGILLPGQRLAIGMANAYLAESGGACERPTSEMIKKEVEEQAARKRSTAILLKKAAQNIAADQDPRRLQEFIRRILGTQYSRPEYFIREAIQNAAAATSDTSIHKIMVLVNKDQRLVRIEDNGYGMSREVMDNVFFNLFSSLNETNEHAAGEFGIGALSFFGLGHEYVKIDSLPQQGLGGLTVIDRDLERSDFQSNERLSPGTTVEIKLGEDSYIDYAGIVEVLERDCCYVRTPIYLTHRGKTRSIQRDLFPPCRGPECIVFDEDFIQGYLRFADRGKISLLGHRIRLLSIPQVGFEGVANCDHFNTTFSRDTVRNDKILDKVFQYLDGKIAELRPQGFNILEGSLETRLRYYNRFVVTKLLGKDGPDRNWLFSHLSGLVAARYQNREMQEAAERTLTARFVQASFEAPVATLDRLRRWMRTHGQLATLAEHDRLWAAMPSLAALAAFLLVQLALLVCSLVYYLRELPEPLWIRLPVGVLYLCMAELLVVWLWTAMKQRFRRLAAIRRIRAAFPRYAPAAVDASTARILRNVIVAFVGLFLGAILVGNGLIYLSEHLAESAELGTSAESAEVPWRLLVPGALGLGLLYAGLRRLWKHAPFRGEQSTAQQRRLAEIKREMVRYGEFKIAYGAHMGPFESPTLFLGKKVLVNRTREVPAWLVSFLYATKIRDLELARDILKQRGGDRA